MKRSDREGGGESRLFFRMQRLQTFREIFRARWKWSFDLIEILAATFLPVLLRQMLVVDHVQDSRPDMSTMSLVPAPVSGLTRDSARKRRVRVMNLASIRNKPGNLYSYMGMPVG